MKKKSVPIISLFLLLFSLSLLSYQVFKVPKEVKAVAGTLNITATGVNTISTPGGIWNSSGNVGIGDTSPSYKLEVAGVVYASGSSRDYKQDIKNLEVDSSKIYDLQPVSYDYKKEYKDLGYTLAGGRQFGLIAEDAYKVIPELVISKNDKKTANIDYEKLSVLLLAELKKLKITVDQQQKQINELKKTVEELKLRR